MAINEYLAQQEYQKRHPNQSQILSLYQIKQ